MRFSASPSDDPDRGRVWVSAGRRWHVRAAGAVGGRVGEDRGADLPPP